MTKGLEGTRCKITAFSYRIDYLETLLAHFLDRHIPSSNLSQIQRFIRHLLDDWSVDYLETLLFKKFKLKCILLKKPRTGIAEREEVD